MTRNCGSDSRENEFSFCSHVQNPVFVLFLIRCPRAIGSISFFRLALAVSLCLVSFSLSCTYFERDDPIKKLHRPAVSSEIDDRAMLEGLHRFPFSSARARRAVRSDEIIGFHRACRLLKRDRIVIGCIIPIRGMRFAGCACIFRALFLAKHRNWSPVPSLARLPVTMIIIRVSMV